MKKSILILVVMGVFFMASCEISDDDNNYNNDGDVNIYDNFANLDSNDIEFDGKVYEVQYDIDTIPSDLIESIVDVDYNNELNGCFQYEIVGFNLNVDSVDHYISEDTVIGLTVYAKLDENLIVYQGDLEGLVFEKMFIEKMFDKDVNDFIYELKIWYKEDLINTITRTVDVNGMVTERDWSEINE